jgi:hypothetical protein
LAARPYLSVWLQGQWFWLQGHFYLTYEDSKTMQHLWQLVLQCISYGFPNDC